MAHPLWPLAITLVEPAIIRMFVYDSPAATKSRPLPLWPIYHKTDAVSSEMSQIDFNLRLFWCERTKMTSICSHVCTHLACKPLKSLEMTIPTSICHEVCLVSLSLSPFVKSFNTEASLRFAFFPLFLLLFLLSNSLFLSSLSSFIFFLQQRERERR